MSANVDNSVDTVYKYSEYLENSENITQFLNKYVRILSFTGAHRFLCGGAWHHERDYY